MACARILCATVFFCGMLSQTADAMTLAEYRQMKDFAETNRSAEIGLLSYLDGLKSGLGAANLVLNLRGQNRLFCEPPNLELPPRNIVAMVDRHLAQQADYSDFPDSWTVNLVLLGALEKSFPCD